MPTRGFFQLPANKPCNKAHGGCELNLRVGYSTRLPQHGFLGVRMLATMRRVRIHSNTPDFTQQSSSGAVGNTVEGSSAQPYPEQRHQLRAFLDTSAPPAQGAFVTGQKGVIGQSGVSHDRGGLDGSIIRDIGISQHESYSQFYKAANTIMTAGPKQDNSPTVDTPGKATDINDISVTTPASLEQALARAQQALALAETSLDTIEKLPSATPQKPDSPLLKLSRDVIVMGGLSTMLVASHAFGLAVQLSAAVSVSTAIAWWGYNRSSLAKSGAVAALLVGTGTLGCSLRFGFTLLAFFISCSKLTQYKGEFKEGLDDSSKKGGQRDWVQVACNGLVPTVIAVVYGVFVGCVDVPLGPSTQVEAWRARLTTALAGAFLGYYASCCGDTWASELGPLSPHSPRLITTLRHVRRGTNGGVTLMGLAASGAGGALMGAVFYLAAVVSPTLWIFEAQRAQALAQWRLIPLGMAAGLVGSVIDSVLGATLQYSGFNSATQRVTSKPGTYVSHISGLPILDNNAVNIVSATITAALTAAATLAVFRGA